MFKHLIKFVSFLFSLFVIALQIVGVIGFVVFLMIPVCFFFWATGNEIELKKDGEKFATLKWFSITRV